MRLFRPSAGFLHVRPHTRGQEPRDSPHTSWRGSAAAQDLGTDGRASVRNGHVGVHRHRGLDAAAGRARPGRRTGRRLASTAACCARSSAATAATRSTTQGDSFFYAFAHGGDAVRCSGRGGDGGAGGGPIRIRVGVHTGEPALDPPKLRRRGRPSGGAGDGGRTRRAGAGVAGDSRAAR